MTARRLWLGFTLAGLPAVGQPALLEITGQVEPTLSLSRADLLDRAGLKPGRNDIRGAIVLLTARDGHQTSFSWSELYNSALGNGVIVVLRQSNDELLDTDGLPGLRSLQDNRPGPRHVRWLTRIAVQLSAERWTAAPAVAV